jgi:hypothetical protein
VIVAALLAGAVVVRNAAVQQYAELYPRIAERVWPSHPSSEIWSGLTQIGLNARDRKPVDPDTLRLINDASIKSPLEAGPFLVRGVQAQIDGNQPLAIRAFQAAELRDGRSIPARYFLSEQYFRSGETARGLREIAVLARMVPNGIDNLAPFIASYAKDPRNRSHLLALFQSDRTIEQAALRVLASDAANADLILDLASHSNAVPIWGDRLLQSLVAAGQYQKARAVWSRLAGAAASSGGQLIFDPGFKGSDAPAPFNWTLTSSTAGLAERQSGGRLHVIFYGQEDGVLAAQLLTLSPGRYRLAMRVAGDAAHARPLTWTVTCARAKESLLAFSPADAGRAAQGLSFEVPDGCEAQYFQLSGKAPDLPQQVDVTMFDLRLLREAANG